MTIREWFRPPRHILAIFAVAAPVSAAALGWLGWMLLNQEQAVEKQRQRDRLEQAADRAAAQMQPALAGLRQTGVPPAGVVLLDTSGSGLAVTPSGSLLYW